MRKFIPLIVCLFVGCHGTVTPVPCPAQVPSTPCSSDASVKDAAPAPPPPPLDACGLGEQNLLKLGCKDSRGRVIGSPDLHNVSWAAICRANMTNGVDMKPACMAAAKNCTEVESCK